MLEQYINGKGKTMPEFNATKQKLSQIEENVLVSFILESCYELTPIFFFTLLSLLFCHVIVM